MTWYAAADVAAVTSDREGTPLARIAAAAAGRTVAAAAGVEGPADRIVQLAQAHELRATMGRDAGAHAAMYDARRLVSDLDRLYRACLMEAQRPA